MQMSKNVNNDVSKDPPIGPRALIKDVRAKMFYSMDFFLKLLLRTGNDLLVSEMK